MNLVVGWGVNWSACGLGTALQWETGWSLEIIIGPLLFYMGDRPRDEV